MIYNRDRLDNMMAVGGRISTGGNVYSGTQAHSQQMNGSDWMKGPVYVVLPRLFKMAGLDVYVTSGKRGPRHKGDQSHHITGDAVDIIPLGKTTFEDIENAAYNNPSIRAYMLEHKLGILDETGRTPESIATMKMTRATGPHLHFGIDSEIAATYASKVNNASTSSSSYGLPSSKGRTIVPKWESRAAAYWPKAQAMYQELLDAGVNPVAAAGILGNIAQESGFNPNAANNVTGGHWGYLQNDRNITPWVRSNYGGYGHQQQMDYLIAGLQGRLPERNMGLDRRFNGFNARMQGVTDPETAAYLWEREYEKSANENIPERKYFARYFYDRMMGGNPANASNPYATQGMTPPAYQPLHPELLGMASTALDTPKVQEPVRQPLLEMANEHYEAMMREQERQQGMRNFATVLGILNSDGEGSMVDAFRPLLLDNARRRRNMAARGGRLYVDGGPQYYRKPEDGGYFAPELTVTPQGSYPAAPLPNGDYGVTAGTLMEIGVPIYYSKELKDNQYRTMPTNSETNNYADKHAIAPGIGDLLYAGIGWPLGIINPLNWLAACTPKREDNTEHKDVKDSTYLEAERLAEETRNTPARFIGGSTEETRDKLWKQEPVFQHAVDSIAKEHGIMSGALKQRLAHEGFADGMIHLMNDSIKKGSDPRRGYSLLNETVAEHTYPVYDSVNKEWVNVDGRKLGGAWFGLDEAPYYINTGHTHPINETWYYAPSFYNEHGRLVHPSTGVTIADNMGLTAAVLRGFYNQVKEDYPSLSEYDKNRYALAYYNQGRNGAQKWVKNGAKGYNFEH